MNIEEYLNRFDKFTKDPDLKAMEYIMERFDNPHKKIKCVHVSGTNGKGSICEMLNNILINAGYRVGKFVSPHLIRFSDGICVDNIEIDDKEVKEILIEMSSIIEEYNKQSHIPVKWFEAITSLVFIYFQKQDVDIAIIESGLGGTTDCTNIVTPLASVIASIDYDHMDILGNTLEEITKHEAGIIKEDSNTVAIYERKNVMDIVEQISKAKNNNLQIVKVEDIIGYRREDEFQIFSYKKYKDVKINLKGKFQTLNASEVLECIDILNEKGFNISDEAIKTGLSTVVHKARLEILNKKPLIVFDGGHNESAIRVLKESVNIYYGNYEKKVYIVSILNTKDYKKMIRDLCGNSKDLFIFTNGISKERYRDNEELYEEAKKYIDENYLFKEELEDAICSAKEKHSEALILIIGSLYTYKNVVEILKK